jgi:hypothetical protein
LRDAEHLQTQRLVDVIVPAGTAEETVLKDYDVQAKRPPLARGRGARSVGAVRCSADAVNPTH